jgi:tetratricopeptide (TPR) repeat protein
MRKVQIVSLALLTLIAGCSTDPEARKAQLLATGNSYYEKGKFKEASLIFRRALQYDARFAAAYQRLGLAELALGRYWEAMQAFQRAADLEPGNAESYEQLSDLYLIVYQSDPKRFTQLLDELESLTRRAEDYQVPPPLTLRVRGFIEIGRQNLEKAVGYFHQARRLNPADQRVALGLAGALSRLGRNQEAERLLVEVIEAQPAFETAYDLLYDLYLLQGQRARAEEVLVRRLEAMPSSLAAHLKLAEHHHNAGRAEARDRLLARVAADPAAFPDGPLAAGDFCLRVGLPAQAERYYRAGAETDGPQRVTCRLRLAHVLAYQGRFPEALKLADEILGEDRSNLEARHLRGALLIETGNRKAIQEATAELEALVLRQRDNPVLRYNLARAYVAAGDLDRAIPHLLEAAQVRDYLAPRYELGRIYLAKQQPELAVQLASEILELHPASITAAMLKAAALLETRNAHQARQILEQVLRRQPGNRQAQFLLASLDVREKRYREAEPVLRRLYESAPGQPQYWWNLSQLYLAQGRVEQALEILNRPLRDNPRSPELLLARATVAANARRFDAALRDFEELLSLAPNDPRVHERLATTYYFRGDLRSAETHYRKALELDRNNATATLRLALLLGELGRREESVALLREALELEPDHPVALNNLAHWLAESPEGLDEALRLAQKAYQKAPASPTVAETLGSIYLKRNMNDEAIQLYRRLAEQDPRRPRWLSQLAQAYLQKGDTSQAIRQLERALALRPSPEEEKRIRTLLEQARR